MSPTIHLVTDRPVFEHSWRDALTASGLPSRAMNPNAFATDVAAGRVFVIDGAATGYDEDELLTAVGLARAVGAVCAVSLPEGNGFSGIEDLLEDMCPGLIVRNGADIQRFANTLGRRADSTRSRRFEYLTVSPRPNELLALLGDGTVVLVPRPVAEDDDGSEVSSIELGGDAQSATLKLGSGHSLTLRAGAVCESMKDGGAHAEHNGNGNGANGVSAVDGARLGARLRELRLAAGLTQAELARRTGIHRPNIARVEAGRHTPSLETLARLASAIGVPTTTVLSGK